MVQVHIYYETLDTEITEEKPAYDLNDFGCKYCLLGGSYTKKQMYFQNNKYSLNCIIVVFL